MLLGLPWTICNKVAIDDLVALSEAYVEGPKQPFKRLRHETGAVQDSTHINGVFEPCGLIYT